MNPLSIGLLRGLSRPFEGDPLAWLEENVSLPHSARSTQFDRNQAPWLNFPFLSFCDDAVVQICMVGPTGGGKTTFLEIVIPYVIAVSPGGMMVVGQGDAEAAEWSESRLFPILENCKPVARLFPTNHHKKRKTTILFPHMPLFIAGANMSSLQEKSLRFCYADEVWRWATGMVGEMKKRHHDRWNRCTVLCSQGGDQSSDLWSEFNSGEIFDWGTTCEGCGEWHRYTWGNIKFTEVPAEDGSIDYQATTETVHHICPVCEHRTENTTAARRAMASRGSYRSRGGNFIKGHISPTYSALAVWWIDWGSLVLEWIAAKAESKKGNLEPLRQFIMKRLAEFWKDEEKGRRDWSVIGERKGSFALETTWDIEQRRFLTVDVQADHFWYVCRAWARGGASRLIAFGKFRSFDEIAGLAESLRVSEEDVAIDSGYDAPAVYRACVGSGYKWKPFKGDRAPYYNVKGTRRAWVDTMVDPGIGTREQGRRKLRLFLYSNPMVKDILALHVRGDAAPWEIAEDAPPEYMDQVTAERKTEKGLWEPIRKDNHAWDLECMQVVCALASGIMFPEVEAPKLTPRTAANGESELASDIPSVFHARTAR